jgi:hypothetical protein
MSTFFESREKKERVVNYQEKLDAAKAIVDSHNAALTGAGSAVDFDSFVSNLKSEGGTSEAGLSACTYEDLEDFGLPKLLARQVAGVFRKDKDAAADARVKPVSDKRASSMSAAELLAVYDPREDNAVSKRLSDLAKSKPCIVFNEDGTVNVAESAKIVVANRDGHDALAMVMIGGKPFKVYKVGERVGDFANENPLYPGQKLRPGDMCGQTGRSWEHVSIDVRQIVYLAVKDTHEVEVRSINDAHNILDLLANDSVAKAETRFPRAALKRKELEEQGTLPSLKIRLGESQRGGRPNDPFHVSAGNRQF